MKDSAYFLVKKCKNGLKLDKQITKMEFDEINFNRKKRTAALKLSLVLAPPAHPSEQYGWYIRATVPRVPYTKGLTLLNGTVQTMHHNAVQFSNILQIGVPEMLSDFINNFSDLINLFKIL